MMCKTLSCIGPKVLVMLLMANCQVIAAPAGVDLANCSGWDIVVDAAAVPSELYAAEEFQHHFQQATGAQLPIVQGAGEANGHVYIGPGKAMQASAIGFKVDSFDDEDYRILIHEGLADAKKLDAE